MVPIYSKFKLEALWYLSFTKIGKGHQRTQVLQKKINTIINLSSKTINYKKMRRNLKLVIFN